MTATEQDDHADIREAVAKLCAQFPGEYWRKLDREMAYPQRVRRCADQAGYLSVLIPEEYGGAGLKLSAAAAILEEIQRAGCNGGGCHAQMYTMGTLLRHGSDAQKGEMAAEDRQRRIAAAGVRRHRADQRHRHLVAEDLRQARRQRRLHRQRPENLDQPRRIFRPDDPSGAHHAEGTVPRSAPTACRCSSST